jgi:hypothetical protein
VAGLVLSGVTAFPLLLEMRLLAALMPLSPWLRTVREGLESAHAAYPWMAYGTDWLAFAHIAIAVFFIGPLRDPVRNRWVLQAGLVCCALVPVLALLAGPVRGIPLHWRLIDCSFGVLGAIPLLYCLRLTRELERR